ncbi:MAG: acyltransferase family protein [Halobacteriovoraceae bacterium]|jgi:1-acyl-sn-glycerol-3-phosphate acyltransferase|nr:acyltransferase family protein [Halobacteriovoraceae bacterium]MBT5093322.1 acyltransferase family protein [Halobacteriovoraceae bacterium]
MLSLLKNFGLNAPKEKFDEVFEYLTQYYPRGEDPWGLNVKKARKSLEVIWPLYHNYFKVRVFGKENVQDQPYMVVPNHTGQIAIDGMLVSTAFALDVQPPRILRGMVERFFTTLPFIGMWAAEGGAVLGDRQNCHQLLKRGQSILAFPEGVRGVAKSTSDFYQTQSFTKGFFRLSAEAGVDVLPVAVVGAEEFYPYVYQAKTLANFFNLPALPLSLNYLPLPSPVDIYIGKPYKIASGIGADSPDDIINREVKNIESIIQEMINEGLANRRHFFANKEFE